MIDKMLYLRAKVAWCSKERTSCERYIAGLEFVAPNKENEKELSCFLNKIYNS
jgi:hypothetical protein